jgi:hypothetical protein
MPALAFLDEIPENKEKEGLGQGERNQEEIAGIDVQHFDFLWLLFQGQVPGFQARPGVD